MLSFGKAGLAANARGAKRVGTAGVGAAALGIPGDARDEAKEEDAVRFRVGSLRFCTGGPFLRVFLKGRRAGGVGARDEAFEVEVSLDDGKPPGAFGCLLSVVVDTLPSSHGSCF
jgi:hypothetical protein